MIIIATLVQSCVYAVPVLIVMIYVGMKLTNARRQIKLACKTPTSLCAEEALVAFLHANNIDDVPVEKGVDCFKNAYEPDKNRIALSPDAYGRVDACSVAYALDAGAQTTTYRNAPEKIATLNRLQLTTTWAFWIVFCVLAFSLMGSSLVGTCVGYALLAPTCFFSVLRRRLVKQTHEVVEEYVRRSGTFSPEEVRVVLRTLDAIRFNP